MIKDMQPLKASLGASHRSMESLMIKDMQPLCASGVGGSGISDAPGFGGKDIGGIKEPSIKEFREFSEEIDKLLW